MATVQELSQRFTKRYGREPSQIEREALYTRAFREKYGRDLDATEKKAIRQRAVADTPKPAVAPQRASSTPADLISDYGKTVKPWTPPKAASRPTMTPNELMGMSVRGVPTAVKDVRATGKKIARNAGKEISDITQSTGAMVGASALDLLNRMPAQRGSIAGNMQERLRQNPEAIPQLREQGMPALALGNITLATGLVGGAHPLAAKALGIGFGAQGAHNLYLRGTGQAPSLVEQPLGTLMDVGMLGAGFHGAKGLTSDVRGLMARTKKSAPVAQPVAQPVASAPREPIPQIPKPNVTVPDRFPAKPVGPREPIPVIQPPPPRVAEPVVAPEPVATVEPAVGRGPEPRFEEMSNRLKEQRQRVINEIESRGLMSTLATKGETAEQFVDAQTTGTSEWGRVGLNSVQTKQTPIQRLSNKTAFGNGPNAAWLRKELLDLARGRSGSRAWSGYIPESSVAPAKKAAPVTMEERGSIYLFSGEDAIRAGKILGKKPDVNGEIQLPLSAGMKTIMRLNDAGISVQGGENLFRPGTNGIPDVTPAKKAAPVVEPAPVEAAPAPAAPAEAPMPPNPPEPVAVADTKAIIRERNAKFLSDARADNERTMEWARQVSEKNGESLPPPPDEPRLPHDMGAGQIRDYIARYFPEVGKTKAEIKRLVDEAIANDDIKYSQSKEFRVGYGRGQETSSGELATRPVKYERYTRESVDVWAAKRITSSAAPTPEPPVSSGPREPIPPIQPPPPRTTTTAWKVRDPNAIPEKLYRGIPANESAPSTEARFGPAEYWTDNPEAARVYAENRGEGATVAEGKWRGQKTLNLENIDRTAPEYSRFMEILEREGVKDADNLFHGENGPPAPFGYIGRLLGVGDEFMFRGATRMGELVREAGYDSIIAMNRGDAEMPSHWEYVHLTPEAKPATVSPPATPPAKPPTPPAPKQPAPEPPAVSRITKEALNEAREDFDLPPLTPSEVRHNADVHAEAVRTNMAAKAEGYARQKAEAGQALSDTEAVGANIRKEQLAQEARAARDSGDMAKWRSLQDQYNAFTDDIDAATTTAGRDLQILKAAIDKDDFSFARVVRDAERNAGRPLTETELAKFDKLTRDLEAAQAETAKATAENARLIAENESIRAQKEIQKERIRTGARAKREVIKQEIKADMDAFLKVTSRATAGMDPEAAWLLGKVAKGYVKLGAASVDEVFQLMKADFGDKVTRDELVQGILAKDPNAPEAVKQRTALMQRMQAVQREADLMKRIEEAAEGVFREPPTRAGIKNPRIAALRAQLNQLKAQAGKTVSDGQRLARVQKAIADVEAQLNGAPRPAAKGQAPVPPEMAPLKEKLSNLRKLLRSEDTLADLHEQMRTGNFKTPAVKPQVLRNGPLEANQIAIRDARNAIRQAIEDKRPMTVGKGYDLLNNTLRSSKATADISATLRQGLMLVARDLSRGPSGAKALSTKFGASLKATFSEKAFKQLENDLINDPRFPIFRQAKGHFSDLGGGLTRGEEFYTASLAERIPGVGAIVKGSERHMVAFLNLMRTDFFYRYMDAHPNATPAELKAVADLANIFTGRGNLKTTPNQTKWMGRLFFAPRFAVSRVEAPLKPLQYAKIPDVRAEALKVNAATAGLVGTALVMAKLAGADVTMDPKSPDWLKARFGGTVYDFGGGLTQPQRLAMKAALAAGKMGGLNVPGDKNFQPIQETARYASYKLAPGIATPMELLSQKTIVGQKTTRGETLKRMAAPMGVVDAMEAAKEGGIAAGLAAAGASSVGIGASTYPRKKKARR